MTHPKDKPLDEWTDGWLKIEVASLLDTPSYLVMSDRERERMGFPASRGQRIDFIKKKEPKP